MGRYARTLKDFDNEKTTIGVHVADLNEVNIAAQITLQANFGAAINDMSLGSLQSIVYGNTVEANQPKPTNKFAQRELKWRVDFTDDVTGEPGHFTIGCANAALLSDINNSIADPLNQDVIDFIAATEAYVLSDDGNPVTVQQIVLVGRNI